MNAQYGNNNNNENNEEGEGEEDEDGEVDASKVKLTANPDGRPEPVKINPAVNAAIAKGEAVSGSRDPRTMRSNGMNLMGASSSTYSGAGSSYRSHNNYYNNY